MHEDFKISHTVTNMLDQEFVKYDIDKNDRYSSSSLDEVVESYYQSFKFSDSASNILSIMPDFGDSYDFLEVDYIYKSIINRFIDDMLGSIKSISNPEIYNDLDLRKVVLLEYNSDLFKYNEIDASYKTRRDEYLANLNSEQELTPDDSPVNVIFYELNNFDDVSYLERDLKDFPEEYLEYVKYLIEGKKHDSLMPTEDKNFANVSKILKGYSELRFGQVRIVYKHLKNNCYSILGAFVKKKDMDIDSLSKIINRGCRIDISTEEEFMKNSLKSSEVESRVYNMILEKSRKGTR